MKKRNVIVALSSLTMASAVTLTASTVATTTVEAKEENVYRTEWVKAENSRNNNRITVFYEDGDQPLSKHPKIEGYEYQKVYVEGGRRYYLFVEEGTKIDSEVNDPTTPSDEVNTQGYKTTDKDNKWREASGKRYFYSKGNPVKGWALIDGKTYYFDSEGVMAKGIILNNYERYYLGDNGIKQIGVVKVGSTTYYFDSTGPRKTGMVKSIMLKMG